MKNKENEWMKLMMLVMEFSTPKRVDQIEN